jgi:alpha-glucoside transport system substrate-binding protein
MRPARTSSDLHRLGFSFEQQIVIDAEAGSAPNVAVFPQPGLASDMASARPVLTRRCRTAWVIGLPGKTTALVKSWVDLGTYAGQGRQ